MDTLQPPNTMPADSRTPSPLRVTRLQEKERMQNLNDRLVNYIETVRRFEAENTRIQSMMSINAEASDQDATAIKKLYDTELEDANKLIEELAKEKARFEIEFQTCNTEYEKTVKKLRAREEQLFNLETRFKTCESEKND
jgi:hypothetical protein